MLKRILPLTLSVCLGAAAAPAALAQAPITEQEAHAIAVDAYVYFYPLLSMDITRKQFTNVGPGKEMAKGPMNMFSNVPEYPAADFKGVVRSNFDTLILQRMAGHDQRTRRDLRTGYQWPLLPAADARHVDRRVCFAGLANDGDQGRDIPDYAARLAAGSARQVCGGIQASERDPADRSANTLCLGDRPDQDRRPAGLRCSSQDPGRLQGRPAFRIWQDAQAGRVQAGPKRRHEDTAEGPGRYHVGRRVFRQRRRVAQASPASCHRRADHRADEENRHRAWQELRHRQA